MEIIEHKTTLEMGRAVAQLLAQNLKTNPIIVLPGGTSPQTLIAAMNSMTDCDWTQAKITTTDERAVPLSDPQSNAGQAAALHPLWLLNKNAPQLLKKWNWPAEFMVLGFGMDGHIASLFEGQNWEQGDDLLIKAKAPFAPYERLSLSYRTIASAHQIILLCPDAAKSALFEEIEAGALPNSALAKLLQEAPQRLQIHKVLA